MILKKLTINLAAALLLAGFSGTGMAITVLNPFPDRVNLGPDIEGSGLYQHGGQAFSVEHFDFGDIAPPFKGTEFGFYFADGQNPFTDRSNLIPIFLEDDDVTPVPVTSNQRARIDFDLGRILDLDSGAQRTFNSQGGAAIGFYLTVPDLQVPLETIYTEPWRNPGGQDAAGALPFLDFPVPDPLAILFVLPSDGRLLSMHSVYPISPVPIPGAAGLWLLGLACLALFRRRLTRSAD